MDVMNILYGDIENEISAYTAIGMFHKIVLGTLAPYQMAQFLIIFNISNVSIWSDLSFDQAKQLLNNLQTSDRQPLLITKTIDDIPCPNSTLSTSKSSTQKGKVMLHQ
jgi:hypothetical protein